MYENGKNNTLYLILLSIIRGRTFTLVWSIFSLFKSWFYEISNVILAFLPFIYLNINKISEFGFKNIFILNNIIQIINFIILIFACWIFNEQIICNFWGLNQNTHNNIIMRSHIELLYIFEMKVMHNLYIEKYILINIIFKKQKQCNEYYLINILSFFNIYLFYKIIFIINIKKFK